MRGTKGSFTGSISRSSRDANIAYLHAIWKGRVALSTHERVGFAQSFYVFICTHIESLLFALIDLRLEEVEHFARGAVHDRGFRLTKSETKGKVEYDAQMEDSHPAFYSIDRMIGERYQSLRNAPVSKLEQIYDSTFPTTLRTVIGGELTKDMDALINTRNIFAHGRRTGIEFNGPVENQKADPDTATLKLIAARLRLAGLIPRSVSISRQNYHAWEASLFSDDALLYFYDRVGEIDQKLKNCPCSVWERKRVTQIPTLPKLLKA